MRTIPVHTTHSVAVADEDIEFTISAKDLPHIYGVLEGLYSDRVQACVREYSTNARDSHIEAGQTRPIEIRLPSYDTPEFTVQDWGIGLSVDDLRHTYSAFGASTKRDNDAVTGSLGLGCKSALAYALSFTVTAVKNGVKAIAVITKNERGIGVIRILDTAGTTEPNGVKVAIPVERSDISEFANAATNLFQFWEADSVLIDDEKPDHFSEFHKVVWIDDDVALIRNTYAKTQSFLVMGNVPYPVDIRSQWGHTVIAYVPPGSVHHTPSREALNFTDLTNETIAAVQEFVDHKALEIVSEYIAAGASPWERNVRYHEWNQGVPPQALKALQQRFDIRDHISVGESNAYKFSANYYRRRETQTQNGWIDWAWIADTATAVIVGFSHSPKSLSPKQRDRLRSFDKASEYVVLHESVDVPDVLIGRPNVFTWEQVVEATPSVRSNERGRQGKTLYTVHNGGSNYSSSKLDTFDPILYCVRYRGSSHLGSAIKHFAEAHIVEITARQVDRFKRLHPFAVSYTEHYNNEAAKAKAALSDNDILAWQFNGSNFTWFKNFDPTTIDDPDFRRVLTLRQLSPSKATQRATLLGVTIERHALWATLNERYPLLNQLYSAAERSKVDITLYLNAKYQYLLNEGSI